MFYWECIWVQNRIQMSAQFAARLSQEFAVPDAPMRYAR